MSRLVSKTVQNDASKTCDRPQGGMPAKGSRSDGAVIDRKRGNGRKRWAKRLPWEVRASFPRRRRPEFREPVGA
jgi:hypothetical protein